MGKKTRYLQRLFKSGKKQGLWWCNTTQLCPDFEYFPCVPPRAEKGPRWTEFTVWKQTSLTLTWVFYTTRPTCALLHPPSCTSTRNLCLASFTSFWVSAASLHNNMFQFSPITCCKFSNHLSNAKQFSQNPVFLQRYCMLAELFNVLCRLQAQVWEPHVSSTWFFLAGVGNSGENTATNVRVTHQ